MKPETRVVASGSGLTFSVTGRVAVAVPSLDHGGRSAARDTRLCALRLDDASLSVAFHPCPEDRHVATTW